MTEETRRNNVRNDERNAEGSTLPVPSLEMIWHEAQQLQQQQQRHQQMILQLQQRLRFRQVQALESQQLRSKERETVKLEAQRKRARVEADLVGLKTFQQLQAPLGRQPQVIHPVLRQQRSRLRTPLCVTCGKRHAGPCDPWRHTCYNCHQPRHVAKKCPSLLVDRRAVQLQQPSPQAGQQLYPQAQAGRGAIGRGNGVAGRDMGQRGPNTRVVRAGKTRVLVVAEQDVEGLTNVMIGIRLIYPVDA